MATNWLNMIADNSIPDQAEVTAPNGEKVTMGQVREAWLATRSQYERKEKEIKQAQAELANVFTLLSEEKLTLGRERDELKAREAQLSNLQDTGQGDTRQASQVEARIAELEGRLKKQHDTQVEMADIWLDDKYAEAVAKFKDDLPEGLSRNDVLKYAMQQGIKDRRGVIDIETALSRITEPKRREKELKEAVERGRKQAHEEMILGSLGSPNSFQTRETPNAGAPARFSNLDDAFAAAAKDATMFVPGDRNIQ